MEFLEHKKSFRKTLLITYISIVSITFIPSVYSIIASQIHTNQYNQIIWNVSRANRINEIASDDIPSELWEIICGKKEIADGNQNKMMDEITTGLTLMLLKNQNSQSRAKLEVANRANLTLRRNIDMLITNMKNGSTVTLSRLLQSIYVQYPDYRSDFLHEKSPHIFRRLDHSMEIHR